MLAAETLYASNQYNDASDWYNKAYDSAYSGKNKKYALLSLDGLLASLGGKGVKKSTKDKYLVKAYTEYLKAYPKSKKSFRIYQRLFNAHLKKNNLAEATKVLNTFKKRYPRSVGKQEAMIASVMEYHRSKGDSASVKSWYNKIRSGEYKVTKKYLSKVRALLLTMEFENVEAANKAGDKKKALVSYVEIYRSPDTSKEAKEKAAYNIAVLFHELGDLKRTLGWTERALTHMSPRAIKKFEASFLVMATEFFNRRSFDGALTIYEKTLKKLCKLKTKNSKVFLKNYVFVGLSENKPNEVEKLLNYSKGCKISKGLINDLKVEVLNYWVDKRNASNIMRLVKDLEKVKRIRHQLVYPALVAYEASSNNAYRKTAMSLYRKSNRNKVPLQALDIIAKYELKELSKIHDELTSFSLEFPEQRFNSLLQRKMAILDKLTVKGISILKIGSGEGIVKSYKALVSSYQKVASEVSGFTPPGKSSEYVKSFKGSMRQLTTPLSKKAKEFSREAMNQIRKSEILSDDNTWFINLKNKTPSRYYYKKGGIIMDRGWRR